MLDENEGSRTGLSSIQLEDAELSVKLGPGTIGKKRNLQAIKETANAS